MMKGIIPAAAALSVVAVVLPLMAQPQPAIRPVSVGQPMPEFTLPIYQGGDLKFSSLKGKNVLLVFPRGLSSQTSWCHVCNYQYSELAEAERQEQIRKKNNLEILWVLPYSRDMITQWFDAFPQQLVDIEEGRKDPKDPQDERAARRTEMYRREFPKTYRYEKGKVPTPFPVLVDADRTLSKGLGFFTEEWSGSKAEQNIPAVLIIDPAGIVQFKYVSQNTFDRPQLPYLLKMINVLK
jgi:peroxiredoxin